MPSHFTFSVPTSYYRKTKLKYIAAKAEPDFESESMTEISVTISGLSELLTLEYEFEFEEDVFDFIVYNGSVEVLDKFYANYPKFQLEAFNEFGYLNEAFNLPDRAIWKYMYEKFYVKAGKFPPRLMIGTNPEPLIPMYEIYAQGEDMCLDVLIELYPKTKKLTKLDKCNLNSMLFNNKGCLSGCIRWNNPKMLKFCIDKLEHKEDGKYFLEAVLVNRIDMADIMWLTAKPGMTLDVVQISYQIKNLKVESIKYLFEYYRLDRIAIDDSLIIHILNVIAMNNENHDRSVFMYILETFPHLSTRIKTVHGSFYKKLVNKVKKCNTNLLNKLV